MGLLYEHRFAVLITTVTVPPIGKRIGDYLGRWKMATVAVGNNLARLPFSIW